jgi:regulator of sigma E protease
MMQRLLKDNRGFADYRFPVEVKSVEFESAAEAGLKAGDRILCINDVATESYSGFKEELANHKGAIVAVEVARGNSVASLSIPVDTAGLMGFSLRSLFEIYDMKHVRYGFLESFPAGISLGVNTLKGYVGDMKYVFTKEGARSIGGFGAIGKLFPASWNWRLFWESTALISIILAFMNILPIPALDGGHVMFLLYEVVTRRKPSDKFVEYAQIAGMAILVAILVYANGNDIIKFLGN